MTSSRDGTARVWKTDRGNEVAVLAGHEGTCGALSFSRTGRRVLTYSEDGTARIWDSGYGGLSCASSASEQAPVTGLDVADDGRVRVTTDENGVARVWSPGRGKRPVVLPIRGVRNARLSPTAIRWRSLAGDRVARIWSTEGVPGLEFLDAGPRERRRVQPGRVGRWPPPAREGVMLWNLREDGRFERLIEAGAGTVDLSFSPDGMRLVTASGGRARPDLGHRKRAGFCTSSAAIATGSRRPKFSPDGKLVVTASADHDAMRLGRGDGKAPRAQVLLRGHGAIVSDARIQLGRALDRDRRAGQGGSVGGPDGQPALIPGRPRPGHQGRGVR